MLLDHLLVPLLEVEGNHIVWQEVCHQVLPVFHDVLALVLARGVHDVLLRLDVIEGESVPENEQQK